jgi:hypothetical protein
MVGVGLLVGVDERVLVGVSVRVEVGVRLGVKVKVWAKASTEKPRKIRKDRSVERRRGENMVGPF